MALNNLLNLPPSKAALKPPLQPLPTRPSLPAPPRRPRHRPSLTFLLTAAVDPKPVVLFNPAWSFDEEEGEAFGAGARGFVGSFSVVYSFTGLEVRGLLSKKRGVLLRCVDGGRFGGESWVLMVENDGGAPEGQEFSVVSRLKKRPTIGEVETMLYNLMATNSPVTKSARFLREMVSNVTGGKAKQ